jgi:hypothetical protein
MNENICLLCEICFLHQLVIMLNVLPHEVSDNICNYFSSIYHVSSRLKIYLMSLEIKMSVASSL